MNASPATMNAAVEMTMDARIGAVTLSLICVLSRSLVLSNIGFLYLWLVRHRENDRLKAGGNPGAAL
jgi:hypothetical protein